MSDDAKTLDFDALHRKYLDERDKRLRPDGIDQYIGVEDEYAVFDDDPHIVELIEREALSEDVAVIIIGGGHSGLFTAEALLKEGITDFRIVEKGGDFGGTWYWNRYPGCRCDIEAYIYMPFLDRIGEMPSEKYARASEILAHTQTVARHFGLYEKACFQTTVNSARWDEGRCRWIVGTDRGDEIRAQFLCFSSGPLNRPKLPAIPGIQDFQGKIFHSSRWDYGYTGGDETGGLTGLNDKNVAIIGTGATGVQLVPAIVESCGHLYVVQRTPASVDERNNRPTDKALWEGLKPGWWEERAVNFAELSLGVTDHDMVDDAWSGTLKRLNIAARADQADNSAGPITAMQRADYAKMEEIRARIDRIVKDPATAGALKPWYNWFCKRPLFVDGYYEAFNRNNVTLVNTDGKGLDRITANAIVANGRSHEVDCIILASGFETAVRPDRSAGFDIIGLGGLSLAGKWKDGILSLHGMYVRDFPNLCIIAGVRHAAASWNFSLIQKFQTRHCARVIRRCLDEGFTRHNVRQEAEDRWLDEIAEAFAADPRFLAECTPGYINNEGTNIDKGIYSESYGGGVLRFGQILDRWREQPLAEDMELR